APRQLPAFDTKTRAQRARHAERRDAVGRGRGAHLVLRVADVLNSHEAREAGEQLALNVRVDDRERLQPEALQRRRVTFVAHDGRPVTEIARAVRRSYGLLR